MIALLIALGLLVIGTALLLAGADWFVDGAGELARALGISAVVVGVLLAGLEPEEMLTAAIASARGAPALAVGNVVGATIVSLGTGAEMIALGVSAARKKRADLLVGGILGSFAYNLLVTLGLAAAIHSIPVDPCVTLLALPVMVVVHLALLACIWYGKISRVMGALLIGVYVAYLVSAVVLRP
jgi:cation:H+ antiporter